MVVLYINLLKTAAVRSFYTLIEFVTRLVSTAAKFITRRRVAYISCIT